MMTRKCRLALAAVLLFFSSGVFAATSQADWVIGAQKFSYTRNQTGSVADGLAQMLPTLILEKLSSDMYRSLQLDEEAERTQYQLRQERNSLFLQLSSEVKRRDSIFLEKYTQAELNRKLQEADKKIQEIKTKLESNLFVSGIAFESRKDFVKAKSGVTEKIVLYNKNITSLFSPSEAALQQGIKGKAYEKEVVNAKINCLITGKITAYDEYIALTIESYLFPGSKLLSTITEVGTVNDADFIASSIVRQLAPVITNSMPVSIVINALSPASNEELKTYIDDILYTSLDQAFIIDSGVHHIQFIAQGYKSAGTNYYFEGNKNYNIEVSLEAQTEKTIFVGAKNAIQGSFLMNGMPSEALPDNNVKIVINGNAVLGQFISQDDLSAFFYIPQDNLIEGALYQAKLKPLDHKAYIEKYRKRMYLSYSVLVTSLVPAVITKGRLASYVDLFNDADSIKLLKEQGTLDKTFNDAKIWNTSAIVCTCVSAAAGVWFVFELCRYFKAANSVLPANTKINFDYTEALPIQDQPLVEDIENIEDVEEVETVEEIKE